MVSRHADFIQWATKEIPLDSEKTLTYRDVDTYAVCCISTSYDVKLGEAVNFLKAFEENVKNAMANPSEFMGKKSRSLASRGSMNDSMRNDLEIPSIEELTYESMDNHDTNAFFKRLCKHQEMFMRQWNADDSKRDKAYHVQNQLMKAKENMQENMDLMLQRDGEINQLLVKGQHVKVQSNRFKDRSK